MKGFDFYEPVPELLINGLAIQDWRGRDNANALFLWRQGCAEPVDQLVDVEYKFDIELINSYRIQTKTFRISAKNPSGKGTLHATCTVKNGKWIKTELNK